MPRPFGSIIELPTELRAQLEALVRARSTPQALVFRCRIILRAADDDEPTNQDIADRLGCNPLSGGGENASPPTASPASKTTLAPVDPGAFPPEERLHVVNLACSKTEDHPTPDSSWTLAELAFQIVNESHHRAMSHATLHRILAAAD